MTQFKYARMIQLWKKSLKKTLMCKLKTLVWILKEAEMKKKESE